MFEPRPPTLRERLIIALGGYSTLLYWYRALRPRWLWRLTSPFGRPTSRYVRDQGFAVKRGPFQGLVYPKSSLGHTNYLSSKLSGVYEPGVVEFLQKHADGKDVFVDVGSGDGFFCVGVARLSSLRVIGFETNRFERGLAGKLAKQNGVELEVKGSAGHAELNSLPTGRKLLLLDVEGFEEELLDPDKVSCLRDATMIVEVHERFRPNVVKTLVRRFDSSHHIDRFFAGPVDREASPEVAGWTDADARLALYDGHGSGDSWMTFTPRQASQEPGHTES